MSARIFVHPHCWSGEPYRWLAVGLAVSGFDLEKLCIGPESNFLPGRKHGRRELVRRIADDGVRATYERMDGTQFQYTPPRPEAA